MLNHVALTVSDRDRSAAFYAVHFGMTERVQVLDPDGYRVEVYAY